MLQSPIKVVWAFIQGEIYNGKHGMSLKLDGRVNDNARARGVVMHAADYVSNSFIRNNNRLGRSQGCPAVPVELSKEIITVIKINRVSLFIILPEYLNLEQSQFLNLKK
jgi:hypothetical protein